MCIDQAHQWNLQEAAYFNFPQETDQIAVTVRVLPNTYSGVPRLDADVI